MCLSICPLSMHFNIIYLKVLYSEVPQTRQSVKVFILFLDFYSIYHSVSQVPLEM